MTAGRTGVVVALVLAAATAATAWRGRTGAVGGSDSACYALMALAYAEGETQPQSALALEAPWPDPDRVAAPGGFLPSETRRGAAVPICAPGYGLLVAPLLAAIGPAAVHVVPPAAAALVVLAAFFAARRLAGPGAGLVAGALTAVHPIVQFQAVQPMNDITTAALWVGAMAAAVAGRAGLTGVLLGVGLLIRPNLALGAVVAAPLAVWQAARSDTPGAWPRARRAALAIAAGTAPAIVVVLALNASLYGSPWRSGYGNLETLFAWAHVPQNLAAYGATWLRTSTPIVLLAVVAPWLVDRDRRVESWGLLAGALALAAVYLLYRPFPEWWYLRFFLPAVVLATVLAAAALVRVAQRGGHVAGIAVPVLVVAAVAARTWPTSEAQDARRLRDMEARFPHTAEAIGQHLAPDAVAVTSWQSGAIRFGPRREIVMWDALDPAWLDRAIAWLEAQGRAPAMVLETWEEEPFRRRFTGQTFGALDWPPRYDVDGRVHVFLPSDRARYLRGEAVGPERLPRRTPAR